MSDKCCPASKWEEQKQDQVVSIDLSRVEETHVRSGGIFIVYHGGCDIRALPIHTLVSTTRPEESEK